jgi:hypothetical protein
MLNGFKGWRDSMSGAALLLSVALHLCVLLAVWGDRFPRFRARPELPPLMVDIVVLEPKDEPAPEPAKPPPPREPPPQRPTDRSEPAPPPPPKPQLAPGRIARQSSPGGSGIEPTIEKAPQIQALPNRPAPERQGELGLSLGPMAKPALEMGVATQSERDFLLSQILAVQGRPLSVWGINGVVRLRVDVMADGMLGPPFDASSPYRPDKAIVDYNDLPRSDPKRGLMEALYVALRVAQPLKLTPEMRAKAPFQATLDFRTLDVP